MLHRTKSQETVSTLINESTHPHPSAPTFASSAAENRPYSPSNDNGNDADGANDTDDFDSLSDLVSQFSQDTLIQPQLKILNHAISEFRFVKEIPILSNYLQTGVHLYPSWSATSRNQPILTRPLRFMTNIFKLNSPFLVIESYTKSKDMILSGGDLQSPTTTKQVYCKVDFKIQSTRITYYVLTFPSLHKHIYLINNNSHSPSVDFELDGTHFRATGVTGTTSALGTSGLIKLYVMENSPDMLTFDTTIDYKRKKLKFGQGNDTFYRLIEGQNRAAIDESMRRAKKLIGMPVAQYLDQGDVKIKIGNSSSGVGGGGNSSSGSSNGSESTSQHSGPHSGGKSVNNFVKHGIIKMFDYVGGGGVGNDNDDEDEMSEEMKMICCVLLVLREQEYRKYKGDKKPQYV
ncbi:hypothetical protein KGF57_000971 [Candida theae]|uniref:Uncharacterized protein n=1 Tax=Candida theae TaxID=1198502 RepID=A0AAD5G0C0_9ASCO|nr:uncharacterized protein KGF57_000971 [Candida theae]KAI5964479.1 hypothetical protein KGF57_000971 [Candida theae]